LYPGRREVILGLMPCGLLHWEVPTGSPLGPGWKPRLGNLIGKNTNISGYNPSSTLLSPRGPNLGKTQETLWSFQGLEHVWRITIRCAENFCAESNKHVSHSYLTNSLRVRAKIGGPIERTVGELTNTTDVIPHRGGPNQKATGLTQ